MESTFKKHYRRMQGFIAFLLAQILAVCVFLPRVFRSAPGIVLLVFLGYCLAYAAWFRRGLSRDGILPAEFQSYTRAQPMMIAVQIVLFLFTIGQAIRLLLGK